MFPKRKYLIAAVLLAVCSVWTNIFFCFSGAGRAAAAPEANFTMENGYVNIRARDILAIEGAFSYDESKYQRGETVIDSNTTEGHFDGQFFFHEGAGDTFTFTVDFGAFKADRFSYMHYGGAVVPTEFKVYAGDTEIGSGISDGGNGWLDNWDGYYAVKKGEFTIAQPLSGMQTIKIEIVSSEPAWPANNIGYFEFYDTEAYTAGGGTEDTVDFIMTSDSLNISARKILNLQNAVSRDQEQFDSDGHDIGVNTAPEQLEYDGQFFIHSGKGDTFTFTVDFGEHTVDSMSFMDYGIGSIPTAFAVYADGVCLGEGLAYGGNGWELSDYAYANYDEILFDRILTGVVEVSIVIVDSEPVWPANNIGVFTFYEGTGETPPAVTDDPGAQVPTEIPMEAVTEAPVSASPMPYSKEDGVGKKAVILIVAGIAAAAAAGIVFFKKKK